MPKRDFAKWFFEGALIVFSVLIALVINEAVEKRKIAKERRAAIERIVVELESNAEIVRRWQQRHGEMRERLRSLLDPDSPLREQILASGFFDLGVVFGGESFIDATLSSSAWEATRTKGLVSELDYETVQLLTDVYTLQRLVMDQTIARFSTLFFDRETHREGNLDGTLIQFQLLAGELVGQETMLGSLYEQSLSHLRSLE